MEVDLDLDRGARHFGSTARIRFSCSEPGASTFLDLRAMSTESVVLNGADVEVSSVVDGRLPLTDLRAENTVEVTATTTGSELFTDKSVVAVRVSGELRDLATELHAGDVAEPVTIDSPDGLAILRHSAAHVMAQAVQQINPEARLGISASSASGLISWMTSSLSGQSR